VLLDLADQHSRVAAVDRDRVVDLRQLIREDGLHDHPLDLLHAA
jgi:hypothetical protein